MPVGFEPVAVVHNPDAPYQHAITTPDRALEVRFNTVPIRVWIEKFECADDRKCISIANHFADTALIVDVYNISTGQFTQPAFLPATGVRLEFDAEWGSQAGFMARPTFSAVHRKGIVLQLHRDNAADAYVTFLYDDPFPVVAFQAAFHALRFAEPLGLVGFPVE